jgi:3-isopropylmalate dehydrogenase
MTYRIGVIGGDGIGPEVTAEGLKCLDATDVAYDATVFDLGWERYERDGTVLPDADLEAIRKLDAVRASAPAWSSAASSCASGSSSTCS